MKRKTPRAKKPTHSRGCAATDALLRAVGRYVKHHGGGVVVAGPVQLMRWPGDMPSQFTIGIKCLGRAPVKEKLEETG